MKKILLLVVLLFLSKFSFSQITLEYQDIDNFFHAGNVWTEIRKANGEFLMDIGVPSLTIPGAWQLPESISYDTTTLTMVTPSSTGCENHFPGATHVHKIVGSYQSYSMEGYKFFKIDQTGIYVLGSAQHVYGTGLDTALYDVEAVPRLDLKLPLTIGMSYQRTYDSTQAVGGISNVETLMDSVDAFGQVFINGVFNQCLRVKSVWNFRVYVNGVLTNSYKKRSYAWYTKTNCFASANADTCPHTTGEVSMIELGAAYVSGTSGIKEVSSNPSAFNLEQNYPNPFNPSTTISFSLQKEGFVKLGVYNILGERVTELVNQQLKAGSYDIDFNASALPSGIYIYKLESDNFYSAKKMSLLK